jgi:hypothetical protein
MDVLPVGKREDRVEHEVRKRLAQDRDPQFTQVHEIKRQHVARQMLLGKHRFLLHLVRQLPPFHPPLEAAPQRVVDRVRMFLLEPLQDGERFQPRLLHQQFLDRRPVGGQRVWPRPVSARRTNGLARQTFRVAIFTH